MPELKELLTAAGLPITGRKEGPPLYVSSCTALMFMCIELIARLLENPSALDSAGPAPTTISTTQVTSELPTATKTEEQDPKSVSIDDPAPSLTNPDSAANKAEPKELTPAEKEAQVNAELEKRKKRAERFGNGATNPEEAEKEDKNKARAERFGTATKPEEQVSQVGWTSNAFSLSLIVPCPLDPQALDKLDQALPERQKRERKGKKSAAATDSATATTKPAPSPAKASPAKATPSAAATKKKEIDPAVKAADEEKKRKREERFGADASKVRLDCA